MPGRADVLNTKMWQAWSRTSNQFRQNGRDMYTLTCARAQFGCRILYWLQSLEQLVNDVGQHRVAVVRTNVFVSTTVRAVLVEHVADDSTMDDNLPLRDQPCQPAVNDNAKDTDSRRQ